MGKLMVEVMSCIFSASRWEDGPGNGDGGVGGVPLEPDRLNTSFHVERSEHTGRSFPSPSLFFQLSGDLQAFSLLVCGTGVMSRGRDEPQPPTP